MIREGPDANAAKTSQRLVNDFDPGMRTRELSGVVRIGAFHKLTMFFSLTADRLIVMCGRYALKTDPRIIASQFGVEHAVLAGTYLGMFGGMEIPAEQLTEQAHLPSYNIAPTHQVPAIVQQESGRTLATFHWGLIPSWAKDPAIGSRMINARVETLDEKPAYRSAAKKRHCIIPADGWFEWKTLPNGKKEPHYFSRTDGRLLGFAGLYESWTGPDAKPIWSCTLITTDAAPAFAQVHDRMPLLVPSSLVDDWLKNNPEALSGLIDRSDNTAELAQWQVGSDVGNVRNNRPDLINEVSPDAGTLFEFL